MTSYLKNAYVVMNSFAKFEKFLPHSITITGFMTFGSQIPELDWGGGGLFCPPYKLGSQNIPYKLGLSDLGHNKKMSVHLIYTFVAGCGESHT